MQIQVLQFIKGLDIGNRSGGSDKFGLELTKALKRDGVQVSLACLNNFDTEIARENLSALEKLSIPITFIEGKNTLTKIYSQQLADYCLNSKISIINSHFQVGTLAAIWARRFGFEGRIARTAHIDKEWGDGLLAWLLRQVFTKYVYPLKIDLQVGVSQNIVDSINAYPGTKWRKRKAHVIHNGILQAWFEPPPIKKYPGSSRKVIGAIGLLIERKGYQYLIASLPKVLERYPEAELVIAGEGNFRPVLEQQIRDFGLKDKVSLLGRQTDIRSWLDQMDLFVLPSLIEGLPTVVIESMARGVPVVASNIPGNDELVMDGETGWLVRARSADELSNAILRAFHDPLHYEKISAQAFNRAQELTIENAAKKYATLYRQLSTE